MVIRYGAFPTRKTEGLPRYLRTDITLDLQKGLHQSKDTLVTHDGLGLKKKKKKKKRFCESRKRLQTTVWPTRWWVIWCERLLQISTRYACAREGP